MEQYEGSASTQLKEILTTNRDKRVVVVGTTCSGKSTLLGDIPEAVDMDSLLFGQSLLTPEERAEVCQTPWTQEIGNRMIQLAKERIKIQPGAPVFGTVVLDADLIIQLCISDEELLSRTALRGVSFDDAKHMQQQIEAAIRESGIPSIKLTVG